MLSPSSPTCVVCGTPFEFKLRGKLRIYCSGACRNRAHYPNGAKAKRHVSIGSAFDCRHCGGGFVKEHKRQFYCDECRKLSESENLPFQLERKRAYFARYGRERRKTDPKFAMNSRINANIKNSLKDGKQGRRWEELVGWTIADLMKHLDRQFLKGMTWENRGEWHIDHIRPVASFNFQTADDPEFRECWQLSNLRPLWGTDNIKKKDTRTHLI